MWRWRIWRGLGKQAAWRVVFVALLALVRAVYRALCVDGGLYQL